MQEMIPWLVAAVCLLCGTVAVGLRPRSQANWLFLVAMAGLGLERLLEHRIALALPAAASGQGLQNSMLLQSVLPGVWVAFSLTYARGNWREFLSRWRWAIFAAFAFPLGLVLAFPGHLADPDLAAQEGTVPLLPAARVWLMVLLVIHVGILINLEKTFRVSVGMTRWRIKYLILGVALIFAVRLYTLSQSLLFTQYDPDLAQLTLVAVAMGCGLIGIGLTRSAFGGFDLYPSRAVLQGSVTAVLAGGYFLVVGLLAQWVTRLGGSESFPAQALVLLSGAVGLSVLLLSERFRTGLQRWISRHFRRPEHDFRKIWTEFTRRTASAMEAEILAQNAAEVVAENFHVLGVNVFRAMSAPPGLERLHATEQHGLPATLPLGRKGLAAMASRQRPFLLEELEENWASVLRDGCPRTFGHGGERLVVPLVAAERAIGVMVLADRVNGVPYSHEELDLLQCIGDQLAGALLNRSLTEEVLQAKEIEAFQTLSTFFVHDLKNAANSLGLMLQNLPIHFDDPDFRADAMRGVGRTVERINQLILKLSSLRHELSLRLEPCRLDLLCAEVLEGMAAESGPWRTQQDLQPVPVQALDKEAIRSVVTHLVSNACESFNGAQGTVTVTTRLDRGRARVTVADDGCGMSPDYVKRFLFRPFHSTKTKGLGIGMFQCKKIIEAHLGSISVETSPGNGTCFTLLLPAIPAGSAPQASPQTHEAESSHS